MAQSAHNRYALGVDIGGSHVCSAVVDLATGQLCGEPHTDKVDAAAGARTIAGAWAANIRRRVADDAERVVALTLGTGVGSGFVAGRRLVTSGDEVPANGWVYCLPFEGGIVDEAFSTRWVCGRYRELTGQEISGAREAAERHAEDPAARRLFDEYGERLAAFAAPVAERFRADMLVLGGNISRAYPLFGPAMERRLEADGHRIRIGPPARPDHAALIGAASLFI